MNNEELLYGAQKQLARALQIIEGHAQLKARDINEAMMNANGATGKLMLLRDTLTGVPPPKTGE